MSEHAIKLFIQLISSPCIFRRRKTTSCTSTIETAVAMESTFVSFPLNMECSKTKLFYSYDYPSMTSMNVRCTYYHNDGDEDI